MKTEDTEALEDRELN